MIAITFALPVESADFRRLLSGRREVLSDGVKIIGGRRHGKSIALLHTGVGRKTCEQRIDILLRQSLSGVISAGFAGGLSGTLSVGDLLVAENFSSPDSLERVCPLLAEHHVCFGKLHTAGSMIDDADQRAALAVETGAIAVDMETEFIARACAKLALPLLSLRAISDTPLQPFPAPPALLFDLDRQKPRFAALALYLTRHPTSAVGMMAFAKQISRARQTLTSALDDLVRCEEF
jgi:nucleoside phosphorylase